MGGGAMPGENSDVQRSPDASVRGWTVDPVSAQPMSPAPLDTDLDEARARLEDLLLSLPYDRALPDLSDLLHRAGLPAVLLHRDDRILKLLHEAVLARPLGQVGEVQQLRAEVELLTLEVELLTDRLDGADTHPVASAEAAERLDGVTARLREIQGLI